MRFTTETGIGYFEDEQGRVVDRFNGPPGEHEAGGPRERFVDVADPADLPEPDPAHQPDPTPTFEERVREVLHDEGLI